MKKTKKLSPSESRAEAATIVLQILLRSRLSEEECARYYAEARSVGVDIGFSDILNEIAWLFTELPEAEADMLARDECS